MNKRQRKKNEKKIEAFVNSFVSSYRELRKLDRSYHEYVVSMKIQKSCECIDDKCLF